MHTAKEEPIYDPLTGDATDEHPAGRIALPGRVRAEIRILALSGAAYVVGGMGLYGVGCSMMLSSSADGGPVG